ncbi:MAG: SMC family ATPase [Acidimicrobiia bacterium]
MRPRNLVMEGFLAYRHRTHIDFSDTDLFVLSGPTGAGKSSVIDAMTFALFGTIPRLDDRRSVAPVISALSDQARVSFEFSIDDETYTAVRLVQRKGSGASTDEARLQRGDDVLASGADDVTKAVTTLIGLSYEHFTKAVVLPQGAFADFLTDRPSDRQALLRALLDLGLFEQVKVLANERAAVSRARIEGMEESLAKLDVPTPGQIESGRQVLESLISTRTVVASKLDELKRLEKEAISANETRRLREVTLRALQDVAIPDLVEGLVDEREAARAQIEESRARISTLEGEMTAVEAGLRENPELGQLETWLQLRARVTQLGELREALQLPRLEEKMQSATAERDRVRADVDRYRAEHAAHSLRTELEDGGICPVCMRQVDRLPPVEESEVDLDSMISEMESLAAAADVARDRFKASEGELRQIEERIVEAEAQLADAPSSAELESLAGSVSDLIDRMAELTATRSKMDDEMADLVAREAEIVRKSKGLADQLLRARDAVAAEEPPLPGEDTVQSWVAFLGWRDDLISVRRDELEEAVARAKTADDAVAEMRDAIDDILKDLVVERSGSPETDLALAVERKTAELEELERTVLEAEELTSQLKAEGDRARVATALGAHLRANNFEAWLMEEALDVLIDGANRLLDELSNGTYSLRATRGQFEVVDHRNADQVRSARSLSGGETFLVALALALSMADQLAQLTGTSSRLESVFLDEGFGALDQESLELVASVLDELAGQGRMVGLVTHVRELAERIPVRYEVTKGPDTARIHKVMA